MAFHHAIYFLYVTKEKLNDDGMKLVKGLLNKFIKSVRNALTIEVYFAPDIEISNEFFQKIFLNGYNVVSEN